MARKGPRLRPLARELARRFPDLEDPALAVTTGVVLVDGVGHALSAMAVPVTGRIALDVGAAAGGFTRVLLEAGAARVYAVDAGHGQLLGSLRQDPRVVALERTNLGALGPARRARRGRGRDDGSVVPAGGPRCSSARGGAAVADGRPRRAGQAPARAGPRSPTG